MTKSLYDILKEYSNSNIIPMHMPGHKRNSKLNLPFPVDIDITEISNFDNLHNMNGLLKNISNNIANVYKVKKSYMLVNGSSGGILSAIYSQTKFNDKIIVARNCHKSVYNIIEIKHLRPIYVMPKINKEYNINAEIDVETLKEVILNNTDAKVVIITSPTYEGIASDIKTIANLCHKFDKLLIVDEAHGAHLGFDNRFIKSARNLGADIVVNSLHKTMPAITQCALIHICSNRVNIRALEKALSMFETSSPSYILMASIDYCVNVIKQNGTKLFNNYYNNLKKFYDLTKNLKNLIIVKNIKNFDIGKLVVTTKNTNISGFNLACILRDEYNIEIEMSAIDYIIAMTSIADSDENFTKFAKALIEIDKKIDKHNNLLKTYNFILPVKKYEVFESIDFKGEFTNVIDCENKIVLEYVWVYPPGIPLLVPGEIISKQIIDILKSITESGLEIKTDYKKYPNLFVL